MTLLVDKTRDRPEAAAASFLVPFWKVVLSLDDQHPVEQVAATKHERHTDQPDNNRNGGHGSPPVVVPVVIKRFGNEVRSRTSREQ
jgi:hypothetical protein